MNCKLCNRKTTGVQYTYLNYTFSNRKYCPSCQYSLQLYEAQYYTACRQILIDAKRDILNSLSDNDFYDKITKQILKGEEVNL